MSRFALAPKNLRDHALQPEHLTVTQTPKHREDALQCLLAFTERAIGELTRSWDSNL